MTPRADAMRSAGEIARGEGLGRRLKEGPIQDADTVWPGEALQQDSAGDRYRFDE